MELELITTSAEMHKMVLEAFRERLARKLPRIAERIKPYVGSILEKEIKKTEEYQSIVNGPLAGHFGLTPLQRKQSTIDIIETIQNGIVAQYKQIRVVNKDLVGGITVGAIQADFQDLLSLPLSRVITEKQDELPWLEWLLTRGDEIIITDYRVKFISGKGRSGQALMIEGDKAYWKVPVGVSGTIKNNWFTRMVKLSFNVIDEKVSKFIEKELNA